jgi:glycerophosphoryl diester phosphodiesterase
MNLLKHPLQGKPLVFGHRGASASAPENTLSAFKLAIEQGADGIELDARLSLDSEVMVLHDGRLDRVAVSGGALAGLKRDEIQRLKFKASLGLQAELEHIPALDEVFETFGDRILYDLEIKNFSTPNNRLESKVLGLIRRFHLEERVFITSFNPWAVRYFYHELSQVPSGLLLLGGAAGQVEDALTGRWAAPGLVGLHHSGLSRNFPARLAGRSIFVWGASTGAEVCRAVELGASGVIVDDPGMARRALSNG